MRRTATIVLCALCLVPRWTPVSRAAAMDRTAAPVGDLAQALSMIPTTGASVYFTDWTLLKQYKGASNLTSQSPLAARIHFLLSLERDQAAPSAYNAEYTEYQARDWSWDFADLLWEENLLGDGPPAYVLRFRDGFDFAPVIAHFLKRGFARSMYHGFPVYSRGQDFTQSWALTSGFAIYNTAVLANRHLLVLSSSGSMVRAILDSIAKVAPAPSDATAIQATTAYLGIVAGAFVGAGAAMCSVYSPRSPTGERAPAAITHQFNQLKRVHPYVVFATGYRDVGARPLGLSVMEYGDANTARQDLPIRRDIVAHGYSLVTRQLYSSLLTIANSGVEGAALVFRFHLARDRPAILFDLVNTRDVAYAGCPTT